jgi:hypothetical protein
VLSLVAGYVVMWITAGLYGAMVVRLVPDDFPAHGAPTERGMVLILGGALPSGIVAGLITGRLAGWAPLVHVIVLAALIGFLGALSSDQARGLPGWFALGRILVPVVALVFGGVIARATVARQRPRRAPTAS